MTVSSTDLKFRKSVVQTDTTANGGRMGNTLVVSGARHALFPRVTASQRTAGLTRYRKEFLCNENTDDETANGVMVYIMRPSNGGDRFYIAEGGQNDTQAAFAKTVDEYDYIWTGCGQLETALSGSEEEVSLTMENDDFMFPNGGYLYLSDNCMTGQTIDSDVKVGDSVYYSGGSWSKISHTDDIDYPNGWCASSTEVITKQETTNEEFLEIATNQYTDEVIGDGNGSDTAPELTMLTNNTNGICRQPGLLPVVTATCGATTRTVNVANDGTCSGYCSAGELNMATGVWTTDITWTTAPDNETDITITYCENAYSYTGNVVTVELAEQVANAYTTAATYGAGCIYADAVECTVSLTAVTTASGTFDGATYPLIMYNDGTVYDTWTLTFSSASAFSVSGAYYGSVGSGTTSADFSPTNADMGQPYFTIDADGWGGIWASGDTITFVTSPSAVPIILCEVVPAGTAQEPNNMLPIGSYTE